MGTFFQHMPKIRNTNIIFCTFLQSCSFCPQSSKAREILLASLSFSLQYFFRLCVVTVTVPLPSRYLTVTVFGQRSTTWLIVHQRDWSLPQRYPPFINVTNSYFNVTQRYPMLLTVTHRYLNVTQRDLNVTYRYSTWSVILKLIQIYQKRDLNVTFTYGDTQGVF